MGDPKVGIAFNAMKALGISPGRVKPVLKQLLKLYDKHWEFIEADNYRVLVEAILDNKDETEDKTDGVKRKEPMNFDVSEQPQKKLHEVPKEDKASSIVGKGEMSTICKEDGIPSIPCSIGRPNTSDSSLVNTQDEPGFWSSMQKGKGQPSSVMIASTEKFTSERGSSSSYSKFPIDESGSLLIPYRGCSSVLSDLMEGSKLSQCVDYENRFDIVSLPSGEVKLCCIFRLGKVTPHTPDIDAVINLVEEEFLRSRTIVGPPFSLKSLLVDICTTSLQVINQEGSMAPNTETSWVFQNGLKRHPNQVYVDDITKGEENVKISLVDERGNMKLPEFFYIPRNIIYQKAIVNISLARISDEDCCPVCSGDCLSSQVPCACARVTNGEFAYTNDGLLKSEFLTACCSENQYIYCQDCPIERIKNQSKPAKCSGHSVRKFIKECWSKCGCSMQCGNRVVQRGITRNLQVFRTTEGKGWGLRTLEDLPRGAFICEYVGEVVTNTELDERNRGSRGKERHTYPVQLDADWGSESILNDDFALCLDATTYGNVARFMNHKCNDANLIEIPVEVETADHHYYHLAFFTARDVKAFEELSWDYGIDFEDEHHPIKAFRCRCGSASCRDKSRKGSRSKSRGSISIRRSNIH
ncbi:histone-lysine N-methyltransferase SUVR4 isoform X3 [Amaranthus tricolor]|nr:histone-lysine N-methyltransferase SUVR4 isoform X3 [Amaranthus tricolor]XP_057515842.1 histone-lysine N-methyltransferase SUVR4 isoform X3 [Amaranthus tricolor]XP_057515843.1 histone-lysine N-methyltransferase SUVR4 isoform X3 [Amaranthus tricolor]XP_057515844.1 histone-lysine N-methyltransferase SUVR4 isoform X3 [Amaranthus tricolor]